MFDGVTGVLRYFHAPRFVRFVIVGAVNTIFGYLIYAGGIALGLVPEIALLLATLVGVPFNFMTTGTIVFASRNGDRMPRFIAVYVVIYGLNALGLRILVATGILPLQAQLILIPVFVIGTFLAMRRFVFQEMTE
jgi:putative flippase GtrA